jgi:hypothetical protein
MPPTRTRIARSRGAPGWRRSPATRKADLAIAEAAAQLVPPARATAENTAPEAEPEPDDAEKPGPESVPDDADPLGGISDSNSPSATQAAPDEEFEAE